MPKSALPLFLLTLLLIANPRPARAGEFERLLPEDMKSFIYLNWAQSTHSAIFEKYLNATLTEVAAEPDYKKYLDGMGVDVQKDVDYFVIASRPKANPGDPNTGVIVIGGRFKVDIVRAELEKLVGEKKDTSEIIKDGDLTLYKFVSPSTAGPLDLFVVPVDSKRILIDVNRRDDIKLLIARASRNEPPVFKDKVATAALAEINEKTSVCLLVDRASIGGGDLGRLAGNDPATAKLAEKLDRITCRISIDTDIKLDCAVTMSDADTAKEVKPALEDLVEKVKLVMNMVTTQEPKMRPLSKIAQGLKVTTKGNDVLLSAKISGDVIDAVSKEGEPGK